MNTNVGRVKLGDFTVVKKIGEGGMGTVYLARQESLERMVALKILPRQFAENPEFVERFRREARAAASLVHPNVVQVYHVGEDRGVHYFAMEYVEGKSLENMAAEGLKFEIDEALDVVAHVAKALDAANEKGLVHRDIKPANVMIDRKGVVKVMDFGLAKPSGEMNGITQPGLLIGTPCYMSPEQGEGSEVDCRSDIYALGAVLYKLLTGTVPFTGDNPGTLIYKHLHETPKSPSEINPRVPAKVDALVLKCLAKKPDDRYASPADLLSAIARLRTGETQTDPTIMMGGSAHAAANANVDVTMQLPPGAGADLTPPTIPPGALGGTTNGPRSATISSAALDAGDAGDTGGGARWKPVAIAAAILLVVGLGALAMLHTGGTQTPPDLPGPSATQPTPGDGPVATAPQLPAPPIGTNAPEMPKPVETCTLGLSVLAGRVPKDAEVTLVTPSGARQLSAVSLQNISGLGAGRYVLSIRRKGYEPIDLEMQLATTGVIPALDPKMVELVPGKELDKAYRNAEELLSAEDPGYENARGALAELAKVAELDRGYKRTEALLDRAQKVLDSEKGRWDKEFAKADEAFRGRRWLAAREAFASIPAWHPYYRNARELMDKADENEAKVRSTLAGLSEGVEQGRFTDCAENLAVINRLAVPSPEIEKLSARIESARQAWTEAEAAFAGRKYAVAKLKYDEVIKACPRFRDAVDRGAACDRLMNLAAGANKGLMQAEALLAAGKHAECLAALAGLKQGLSPEDDKRLAELRLQAETGQERERVDRQLAAFDAAFTGGEVDGLVRVMDRSAREGHDLAVSFEREARDFFDSGLAVEGSRHEIGKFSIVGRTGEGLASRAQAEAVWKFSLRLAEIGRNVTGSVPQTLEFNCVRGVWLLSKMAPNGGVQLAAAGSRPAAVGQICGRVREVEGDAVVIDRGSEHGVAERMVFDLFAEAKVVKLPFSGDAPVFVEEHPVAAVEVVRVERQSARCAFLPDVPAEARRKVAKGMLAASSLVRRAQLAVPVVAGHDTVPKDAQAAAGRPLVVSLDVPAIEGAFLTYEWSADGGILSAARTAEPRVVWTAPGEAGTFKITATVRSSRGDRSAPCTIEVRGTGPEAQPPASYELLGRICAPDLIERVQDVAFDEKGRACVLDSGLRRVLVLDPELRVTAVSGRWPTEFSRLAAHDGVLYCLDSRNCTVKRFALGAGDPFAKPIGPDIGASGEGNGRFRSPVDLAVSPSGELHVLDAQAGAASVQVFDSEGAFVTSFGWGGTGPGALREPVAIDVDLAGSAYVLDAAERRVVIFRSGRPAGEFSCADATGKPVDLACDASTAGVLVLDANFKQVAAFSATGERRADRSLGLTGSGPGELASATRLAASRAGEALAVSGEGRHIDRFAVSSEFLGRLGGELFSSHTRVAAGRRGELVALDCKSGIVRRVDPRGWVLSEFGGGRTFEEPLDVACDERGTIYVLDGDAYAVLAFDPAGKPLGKVGKKGTPPAGLTDALALAALSGDFLAVACDWKQNAMVRASIDRQELIPLPMATAKPRFVAVDRHETVYAAGSSGQVERCGKDGAKALWTAQFKGLTGIEACGSTVLVLDSRERAALACNPQTGEVIARTERFPAECDEPKDLAASAYETLFVFDAATRSVLIFRAKR